MKDPAQTHKVTPKRITELTDFRDKLNGFASETSWMNDRSITYLAPLIISAGLTPKKRLKSRLNCELLS